MDALAWAEAAIGSFKSISPISSLGSAWLQSGPLCIGVGLGAGVGGLAGADGKVLPGMVLGLLGIGIGMEGMLVTAAAAAAPAICFERLVTGALPWRGGPKRLLYDCDCIRASEEVEALSSLSVGSA